MANDTFNRGVGEAAALLADLAKKAAGAVTVIDIGLSDDIADPGLPRAIPIGVRAGATPEFLDLRAQFEKWRVAPERRKGTARATTLASFIALVERHKDESSVLFAKTTWPQPHLQCVFDYHAGDAARFGEHRARYDFPVTPEFAAWIERNEKPFNQAAFAQFVEDRIAELSVPLDSERETYEKLFKTKFAVPTDLVDLARGLEVHVGGKIKSAFKTQTGEAEITFEETHNGKDGEPLFVPGLFVLRLPAFLDGGLVSIIARLRYRVVEGALVWFYSLYQWEEVLRLRVATDFATAASQTGLLAIEGAPET